MDSARYVIVGGGLAGGNAAVAIRERDPDGRIVLVTEEPVRPYDRVPLSKRYLMGLLSRDGLFLRKEDFYKDQRIELLTSTRATTLDPAARCLSFSDGRQIGFERLLLATGGRPRRLAIPGGDLPGIYYLRTIDDSDAIKDAITRGKRAVIVGGGFIGCEVAAACVQKGLEATVVEMGPYLLNMAFDEPTGRWVTGYLEAKGIQARLDDKVARFVSKDGRFGGVETTSGEVVHGDFAAVGVGIALNDELAQASGLKVEHGIVVDDHLRSSAETIFAAGDVARFYSPIFNKYLRLEHYDVAVRQGKVAGANMAGAGLAFAEVPYFFSDMFDLKIHAYGDLSDHDRTVLRGRIEVTAEGGFVELFFKQNRLVAFLGVNRKIKEERAAQKVIAERKTFDDPESLADPTKDLATLAQ
jgi:3-phenylpropionate/trans-cinnamate dioxygenase ferredoxin reductase component